ncbi:unnamed protein product [Heligmosomoides polygyrus]|uniref:Uncharacterized protein n=1 Tax=Heligmosomoides polygyrus TaxID=6339 RepID=A0A183FK56_HELPZ|nr:unnamed protein product [Heligmosomoides polygyrus]
MYGAECWPAIKEVETRLSVMETKMLRWTAGVTRLVRIRNDVIRQKFGVASIADKMREARLRWNSECPSSFPDDSLISLYSSVLRTEVYKQQPTPTVSAIASKS